MPEKNIIYIEDRPEDVKLVKRIIENEFEDVSLIAISDSEQALGEIESGTLQNFLPSLVLIDINMPKISGFQILEAFAACQNYKKLPKVIYSSSTHQSDIDKAYDLHCNSFIKKPASYKDLKEQLVATVQYWLTMNVN